MAYGWNVTASATPTTWSCSTARLPGVPERNDRPTLIIVDSHIGWGAPHKQDTSDAHGEPLGEEEIRADQEVLRLARGRQVPVPDGVYEHFRQASASAARSCATPGSSKFADYKAKFPELADQLYQMQHRQLPDGWDKDLPDVPGRRQGPGRTRILGQGANAFAKNIPWLIGGAADLAPSTKTLLTFEGAGDFERRRTTAGRNFHFGIREHAMGAISTACRYRRSRPTAPGFLIFSDYVPRRRSVWRRSWNCPSFTSSRTTRSASARTARPISRSSSSPRSARFPACSCSGPAMPTKSSKPGGWS